MNYEDRIRERAHRIWEEEGRPEGRHREHWERACREIDQTSSAQGAARTTPGATRTTGTQTSTGTQTPTGNTTGSRTNVGSSSLVGSDDAGVGTPDAMGVDDLNVSGRLSDPKDSRPTTGRSKLVGS